MLSPGDLVWVEFDIEHRYGPKPPRAKILGFILGKEVAIDDRDFWKVLVITTKREILHVPSGWCTVIR